MSSRLSFWVSDFFPPSKHNYVSWLMHIPTVKSRKAKTACDCGQCHQDVPQWQHFTAHHVPLQVVPVTQQLERWWCICTRPSEMTPEFSWRCLQTYLHSHHYNPLLISEKQCTLGKPWPHSLCCFAHNPKENAKAMHYIPLFRLSVALRALQGLSIKQRH